MAGLINRRFVLGLAGAALLAGCSGVTPYKDAGPANMELRLSSIEGGFLTKRAVYLDVWTGPKGPNMQYLGTRKFDGAGTIGLPVGRPLHLALAFEEGSFLGGASATETIEVPMKAIRSGQRYRLTVAYDDIGFDWDLDRIR